MSERTQEQVIGEIHRQRDELVSAVTETRREVTSGIEHLKRRLPILGAAVGVVVVALATRKLARSHHKAPVTIERLRIGRFSLLERV
jgi:hypothetical protein